MRVLFVDDNAMNREVVRGMLEAVDVALVQAESAEIGLELVETETFDLILMDLRMPGMDGLAAIRAIRARNDAKSALPIIVVTADNGRDVRSQAMAAGADDLLHKPVQMQLLFDAIGHVTVQRNAQGAMLA